MLDINANVVLVAKVALAALAKTQAFQPEAGIDRVMGAEGRKL